MRLIGCKSYSRANLSPLVLLDYTDERFVSEPGGGSNVDGDLASTSPDSAGQIQCQLEAYHAADVDPDSFPGCRRSKYTEHQEEQRNDFWTDQQCVPCTTAAFGKSTIKFVLRFG